MQANLLHANFEIVGKNFYSVVTLPFVSTRISIDLASGYACGLQMLFAILNRVQGRNGGIPRILCL